MDETLETGGAKGILAHDNAVVGHNIDVGLYHAAIVLQRNYVNVGVTRTHLLRVKKRHISDGTQSMRKN